MESSTSVIPSLITRTNEVIAKYIARFQAPHHDNKEIRETLTKFLRFMSSAELEFRWTMVEKELASCFRPLVSNLLDFIVQQYHVTVLESVPLDLKAPLMLAYYIIELFSSNKQIGLLLENSIVHCCVHQLRGLQIFLSFNEVFATIAACLLNIICDCCIYLPDDTSKQAVQYSLHHVLAHYSTLQFVNVSLLAKATLAVLCDKERLSEFYRGFTQLSDSDFSNLARCLKACLQTDDLNCVMVDQKGGPSYSFSASNLLTYFFYFAKQQKNYIFMSDTEFLRLLHSLMGIELAELQCEVVRVLLVLATYQVCASKICTEVPEILLDLEKLELIDEESMIVSTAEAILVNANMCITQDMADVALLDDQFEDVGPLLKTFVRSIEQFLKGITHGTISAIFNYRELRSQIGLLMSILRMMSQMNDKQSDSIACLCLSELTDFSSTLRDYTSWMFTGHLKNSGEDLLSIPPTHPLALFHIIFHEMSNASHQTQRILLDSGVFSLMVHEVESLVYLKKREKGISWFMHICLAIITNCYLNLYQTDILREDMRHEVFGPLCIAEEFDYRLPAKIVISSSQCPNDHHRKLTEILDSEVKSLFTALKSSVSKKVYFVSPIASRISFTYHQLLNVIDCLLDCNSVNLETVLNYNQSLSILDEIHSSNLVDALAKEKIVSIRSQLLSPAFKSLDIVGHNSTLHEKAPYGENNVIAVNASPLISKKELAEYWMSCIMDCAKTILTKKDEDLVEDRLQECFQEASSIDFDVVVSRDKLAAEALELFGIALFSEDGRDAFLSLAMELRTFFTILGLFIEFSSSRLIEGIKMMKVPSATIIRLEYLLSLLHISCQNSERFCLLLGETGVIQSLDDMLHTFVTYEIYCGLPQIMKKLTDLVTIIIAVCGCVESFQGYLTSLISTKDLMNINRTENKIFAKCIYLNLHAESIADEGINLDGAEVDLFIGLIQSAVESENAITSTWPLYTIECTHSLEFLFKVCIRYLKATQNIDVIVEKGILTLLNLSLQLHGTPPVLKVSLMILEMLAQKQSVQDEVSENYQDLIATVKAYQNDYGEEVFFCLRSLGENDFTNNTGLPDFLLEAMTKVRCMHTDVITILQKLLQESIDKTTKLCLMKMLGDAAYQVYQSMRLSTRDKGKIAMCLENAKTAVRCIGYVLDEEGLEAIMSRKLDIAMMDLIFKNPEKSLQRCLLCRRKCRDGEKLIHSHVWPESLLRAFMDSKNIPGSLKIFDASWKKFGYLQGPGQLAFYMLCKCCEERLGLLENWFKSNFFSLIHNDSQKPSTSTVDELQIDLPGSMRNQLYLFCLSMVFRVTFLASYGFINRFGNSDQIHNLFNSCRNLLMKSDDALAVDVPLPRIAIFFTPVHFMSKMKFSPSFMKVIFSMGIGCMPSFKLHDGDPVPNGHADYLLCSIADINIIAFISENSPKFVPKECLLEANTKKFTVPSALKRFLLFPKGLFKEFEALASLQMSRALQVTSNRLSSKSNISWASEEKELYMNALTFPSEKDVDINFLPHLFSGVKSVATFCSVLKSSPKMKLILHFFNSEGTLGHLFIVKVIKVDDSSFELHAFLTFQEKGFNVWIGYKLSVTDLSVMEALQFSKEKAEFFCEIEEMLSVKAKIVSWTNNVLEKAGFRHKSDFLHILKYKTQLGFDVKCTVPCYYCLDSCGMCCKPGATIIVKIHGSIQVARVCSKQCAEYAAMPGCSTPSEAIERVHVDQSIHSELGDLLFTIYINGSEFGFDSSMLLLHLFKDLASSESLLACFQIRSMYHQQVFLMKVSNSFDSIQLLNETDAEIVKESLQQELLCKMKRIHNFT